MNDWLTLASRELHRAPAAVVRLDRVRVREGVEREYVVVDGPAVALVVPFLDDDRVVLVRQYRHAWGLSAWECPAGHVEPGETPEAGARRELEEEAGLRAAVVEPLLPPFFAAAKVASRYHAFVARGLVPVPARPDADEELEPRPFTRAEALALIGRGEVSHGPSALALFAALR